MSSAPHPVTESAVTAPTGKTRRLWVRRLALGLAGVGVIGASMTAGWILQARLHPPAERAADVAPAPPSHDPHAPASDPHAGETPAEEPAGSDSHHAGHGHAAAQPHAATGSPVEETPAAATNVAEPEHAAPGPAPAGDTQAVLAAEAPAAKGVAPVAEVLARALATGEECFQRGDAAGALRDFDWVAKYQDRSLDDRFRLRRAVCAESLGELDRALEEYGAALAATTDETVMVHCRLGQARVWRALGHSAMALQLLSAAFLTNGNAERAAVLRPFVAYSLADVLAGEGLQTGRPAPFEDNGVLFPTWKFDLFERTLMSSLRRSTEPQAALAGGVRIVTEGPGPDVVLQVSLPRMGLRNAVDALCRATNRKVTWSAAARQATTGRTSAICVSRCSLGLCLDALTAPVGVTWLEHGDEIRFEVDGDVGGEQLTAHHREGARRALQHAVQEYPHFLLAPQALVTLGNLAFLSGRQDEAAASYTQVFATSPRSPICGDAWFNLGKLELQRDRPEAALESFWHVVDAGGAPEAASAAYLFIGRLLLDSEQPRRAILPLTRSIQWTKEGSVRARAVLTLAAAHLLHGNPQAANEVLMDFRSDVAELSEQAAYLSALARYRFTQNPARRLSEGESLLSAAKSVEPDELCGRCGWYLCGQVYQELLLPEEAIEVYREGLRRFERVPYRNAMLFGLATSLTDSGESAAAQEPLTELMQQSDQEWQRKAAFRLCRLQLDQDQLLPASRTARALLGLSVTTDDKSRALQLLGQAYQRLGDHASAALCFAGSTPGETSADAGEQ